MIFSKIKLTKAGTLEATYKNEDGDVIHYAGANLVHKDLKEALQGLIPHLAIITILILVGGFKRTRFR